MLKNYIAGNKSFWNGRIDSNEDYDCFRWHQWVEFLDLNDDRSEVFKGKLGFAFLGFECDYGINLNKGRVGAANGPRSIRKELSNLPCQFNSDIKLFDAGNIYVDNLSLIEAQENLAKAVDKILSLNLFPILLGGGHEIAFGHYMGLFNHYKNTGTKQNIGIINFDAHFDLRPYAETGGSSGTMFRQIYDMNKEEGIKYSYFCLGVQRHSNTVNLFKYADEIGAKYVLAKDIVNGDMYSIFEKLDDFIREQDNIYVTICSDVFSTSFAPGVSAPQPLGLDPEKVILFLKRIFSYNKVISFDIAEVSPRFDQDSTTASLAAVLIFSVVTSLAKFKQ
ncbi:formimidoylglutamase [Peptoniphilus mikwangii]|uniref:formimidoylglutamase n=1 Tax=Peptoniphilus mikwangii TaxID=1354300 RepID=UPI00042A46AA|nr:formimidoylglutamase [Peptoniphilus mikwangii]